MVVHPEHPPSLSRGRLGSDGARRASEIALGMTPDVESRDRARGSRWPRRVVDRERSIADPFYLAMGATKIGATSPVDGAPLPLLEIELVGPAD